MAFNMVGTEKVVAGLDRVTAGTGAILAMTPLALVIVQFSVVLMVYVFGRGSVQLQESLQYINALMFLGGAGYTALKDDHVRVDLIYSRLSPRGRTWVNFVGTCLLLVPFLAMFWWASLPYVLASWSIGEGSVEASGLPFVYILKSTLLLFALTLSINTLADLLRFGQRLFSGTPS